METSVETNNSQPISTANDRFVIAIGASAGGLEAIQEFFDHMPSTDGLSFVVIQHLSPDYKSLLVEILAKHTHMQVQEASHNAIVKPNTVYVIPNKKWMTIAEGRLQLTEKSGEKGPNTAIDIFLKALAEDQGAKAIAVILSGTGTDGSRGIETVQAAGGMVLVQDPVTAKFDGMPNSAIASGYVDYILAPELMPGEIAAYIKERPVRLPADAKPGENYLPEVLKLVEKSCQYDFTNYKTPTILRRISRRMSQLGHRKFSEYLDLLRTSGEECKLLGKEFLIGVTKFFRDRAAFDLLGAQAIQELIENKHDGDTLKIWVVACSTGEEAYSIAIMADDLVRKSGKQLELKIFATDIDLEAIEFASRGIYPAQSISEVDEQLVKRNFIHIDGHVQVHPQLRKQIVFARHNILKDPPFIKNDLVSCRNMLIYMNSILQRRVFATLQFSLNTGGYLFLGPSEVPTSIKDGLQELNGKWKLYRKIFADSRYNPERLPTSQAYRGLEPRMPPTRESAAAKDLADDFKKLLTDEYGFAALYVDRSFEVREAVGDYRRYLSLPEKNISLQLLKMVSPEVAAALNGALRKAAKEGGRVTVHNIKLRGTPDDKNITVHIKPASKEGLFLIAFSDAIENVFKGGTESAELIPETAAYLNELEEELKETRVNLQLAVEGLESANEELQSSNEELLSANEELQSSNEELQSLNEELHTLNTEHQLRIKELIELNDDLNNYFRSTEIGQVFLDADLRIRKFNPSAVQMVNLIETDIGRPIQHISTNLKGERLYDDSLQVMKSGELMEKEVLAGESRTYLMRILPYLRKDNRADGVVVSFVDITRMKEMDSVVKGVFNASPNVIMALKIVRAANGSPTLLFSTGNHAAEALMGESAEALRDKALYEAIPAFEQKLPVEKLIATAQQSKPWQTEVLLPTRSGSEEWFSTSASPMGVDGLVLTLTNMHEKKMAEDKFRYNYHELLKTKENLRNLNQQLEQRVADRTADLGLSEERFRLIAGSTNDVLWDWDLVTNQWWWNDLFVKVFGYTEEEVEHTHTYWIQHLHPAEKETVLASLNEALNKQQEFWHQRFRFRKKNGEYAVVDNRARMLYDENGIPYRVVGSIMDVTQAEKDASVINQQNADLGKMAEEFQFVTDFMPQMVWATQPDGYHDFFNKGWYDYTGLSYEQTAGEGWNAVLHPEDKKRSWELWQYCVQTGEPYEIEYRFRRYDGVYRWFLGRALALRNETGQIVKWFGTCTDIQEQKEQSDVLEAKVKERTEELERTNAELETSNTELLQFASVASHDLKEPLRKISMFGNLIRERYLTQCDPSAVDYMDRITTSSARMTRLINDLLDFSRVSIKGQYEMTDLNSLIEEVLSDLEVTVEEKGALINVGRLCKAEVIPGQMRQVFQNIISNALKFNKPNTTPVVEIGCTIVASTDADAPDDMAGDFCRIIIRDNGIGFDNSYAQKIFIIFQRLHAREKYDGTGIGLAVTRKIVERHHGTITARSEEGSGSEFILVLPLRQPIEVLAEAL